MVTNTKATNSTAPAKKRHSICSQSGHAAGAKCGATASHAKKNTTTHNKTDSNHTPKE